MRVYLDTCCLSRLLDDWTDARVWREARSVQRILGRVEHGAWEWVASGALADEIAARPDEDGRLYLLGRLTAAQLWVPMDGPVVSRGDALHQLGFGAYDALHLACAERGSADVLLTTDDRFLRRAKRWSHALAISVQNPLETVEGGQP